MLKSVVKVFKVRPQTFRDIYYLMSHEDKYRKKYAFSNLYLMNKEINIRFGICLIYIVSKGWQSNIASIQTYVHFDIDILKYDVG